MKHNKRTVLVTGGAVRLGAGICTRLAADGWQIILHYGHSEKAARALAERLREQTVCVALQADLTQSGQSSKLMQQAVEAMGTVHALVNNAALFPDHDQFGQLSAQEQHRLMQLNLFSPLELIQCLQAQKGLQQGAVVNVLDARLQRPGADHFYYRQAKGGLMQATRDLALQLAPRLRINGVGPGAILPPPGKDQSWLEQQKQDCIPLQHTGSAEDVADAVTFLLQAEFVTGQILHVDGGEFLA